MSRFSRILVASGISLGVMVMVIVFFVSGYGMTNASASGLPQTEPTSIPSLDHSLLPQLDGPFETASDVTAVCLTCHSSTARQVMSTVHWTWSYENPVDGKLEGMYNVINNFYINPQSNEPRCTSCHAGYGWKDNTFDFSVEKNVDCLVCHDQTGTYQKFPTGAGEPAYEDTTWQGEPWPAVDLVNIAQHVGLPTRQNCGTCHFYSDGGDGVKHGDLNSSLLDPDRSLDVHMSAEGANFQCTDCHTTDKHQIAGSTPSVDPADRVSCSNCHSDEPHDNAILNFHTATVSCQACHIPTYARGRATMMTWDWSKAGQMDADGKPYILRDENGDILYDSQTGEFTWESDVVPDYVWKPDCPSYQT